MILAYRLGAYDGHAFFFEDRRSPIFCPICGTLLEKNYLPTDIKPGKRWDVLCTYENRKLVNERFKQWCERQEFEQLRFRQVCEEPAYYLFEPLRVVNFDPIRAKTRFVNKCARCGNYESVVGTSPPGLLNVSEPIQDGFLRTDLEFGSRWEKSPIIVVGTRTRDIMKQEKFRLIDFEPIKRTPDMP